MSCLGKLFCSILNARLVKFLPTNEGTNKYQIAFSEDCRTSDHILTLKTLTDKYQQNNQCLYACFVDFKKAFDSVWRDALFFKMLKHGIGGCFGKIIRTMYSQSFVQVKLQEGLTNPISDNVGVKQGCVLSPTLFKIFINDFPDIFDQTCDPVHLYNDKLNCLMFADDIVILSETRDGLQNSLDKLSTYCRDWSLTVNTDKTKIVVFNKKGKLLQQNLSLGGSSLESVISYTYLGITLHASGHFHNAISSLSEKATKAMFKLRNSIYRLNLYPKLGLALYDSLIRPICTYACDVWGAFLKSNDKIFNINKENYNYFDGLEFEKLELRYMRSLLGVHRRSSNAGVRGELGRYPTTLYALKQAVKNLFRVANYDKNSVLYDAYLCNVALMENGKKCWLSNLSNLIKGSLGLTHIWENRHQEKKSATYTNMVHENMQHIFVFQWKNFLNKNETDNGVGNKLRTYHTLKRSFEYENYLSYETNYHNRSLITKMRISAHKLEIETGRYNKKKIKAEDRTCKQCTMNVMEDEKHVILLCPKYSDARNTMFSQLNAIFSNFSELSNDHKFIFTMSCPDYDTTSLLSKMLSRVKMIRGII
jgi:hypothetical protein